MTSDRRPYLCEHEIHDQFESQRGSRPSEPETETYPSSVMIRGSETCHNLFRQQYECKMNQCRHEGFCFVVNIHV